MCGIAGIVNFKKNMFAYEAYNRLLVRDIANTLSHKYPDTSNEWVGEHAAFSHMGLSGIDTEGTKQPMKKTVEGYEFVITFDGELYNTDELKNDLIKCGYIFTTNKDTEVLLYSYIHYGVKCCEKLNGIYSFSIWDSMRQQIFICRDRFGVKPLFYAKHKDTIIFASEIKALFSYPNFTPKIDKNGLCELFAFFPNKIPGVCIFKDVEELKPATYIIINRLGFFEKQYCDFEKNTTTNKNIMHNIDLQSRINVLKPIIAQTLDLKSYSKMRCMEALKKEHLYSPYPAKTTQKMLNEILEDKTSPISVFIDTENALSTPELMWTLIKINDIFKEFNPIII